MKAGGKARGARPAKAPEPLLPWVRLAGGLVALLVFLAFLPVLSAGWVNFDDQNNFLENQDYRGLSAANLKWMWSTFHMGHYQPLSWMTLGLDHCLWRMDARGYHATNLLLHALNAVLFYLLLRLLLARALPGAEGGARIAGAAAGALLYALHPLRVESVAWVTERRDVLSLLFLLLSLRAWLGAVDPAAPRERRRALYWWAVGAHALSLLAKAYAITLPFLLLLMDLYPLRRWPRERGAGRLLLEKVPFLVLAVGAAAVAVAAQRQAGALKSWDEHGLAARLAVALHGAVFYLHKTVLPLGLSPLYILETPVDLRAPRLLPAGGVFLALAAGLVLARRRFPAGLAAFAAYLILLAPVLGLSQAGPQETADRYTFLAHLPLAALAAAGTALLFGRERWRPALLGGLALLAGTLGGLAYRQARHWRSGVTLWEHAVTAVEPNFMSLYNLGEALAQERRFVEAIGWYRRSLEVKPGEGRVLLGWGMALLHLRRFAEAGEVLGRVEPADRGWYSEARFYMGQAALLGERPAEAAVRFEESLASAPDPGRFRRAGEALVGILERMGRHEEAQLWLFRLRAGLGRG